MRENQRISCAGAKKRAGLIFAYRHLVRLKATKSKIIIIMVLFFIFHITYLYKRIQDWKKGEKTLFSRIFCAPPAPDKHQKAPFLQNTSFRFLRIVRFSSLRPLSCAYCGEGKAPKGKSQRAPGGGRRTNFRSESSRWGLLR